MENKKTPSIAIWSLIFGCIPVLVTPLLAIILGIIALVKISKNSDTLKGKGFAIAGIVLGVMCLTILPMMAIPGLLRARIKANETATKETVKIISSAIENYKAAHNGIYPLSEEDLLFSTPPYLAKSYDKKTIYGYKYSLDLSPDGYEVVAAPKNCGIEGDKIFMVRTGQELTEIDCKIKEGE